MPVLYIGFVENKAYNIFPGSFNSVFPKGFEFWWTCSLLGRAVGITLCIFSGELKIETNGHGLRRSLAFSQLVCYFWVEWGKAVQDGH